MNSPLQVSDFVIMLGKHANAPCVIEIEQRFDEKLDLSFHDDDTISKITILINRMMAAELMTSISENLKQNVDKKSIIGALGEPTHTLTFPAPNKNQGILFYNYGYYWLAWKFTNEEIETVAIMSSDIIPEVIKSGQVPMRLCRS